MGSDTESKKRTVKACDRCRLKKVKCDGAVPCSRCKYSDVVCQFGASPSTEGKSVSAAHANQLYKDNEILIQALRSLWDKYARPRLGCGSRRTPSIHDIVTQAGLLNDGAICRSEAESIGANNIPSSCQEILRDQAGGVPDSAEDLMDLYLLDTDFSCPDEACQNEWSLPSLTTDSASSIESLSPSLFSHRPLEAVGLPSHNTGLVRANRPKQKLRLPMPFGNEYLSEVQPWVQMSQGSGTSAPKSLETPPERSATDMSSGITGAPMDLDGFDTPYCPWTGAPTGDFDPTI